jgi:hypothetical protein
LGSWRQNEEGHRPREAAGKELDLDHAHREATSDEAEDLDRNGVGDTMPMMAMLTRYQNGGSKRSLPKRERV